MKGKLISSLVLLLILIIMCLGVWKIWSKQTLPQTKDETKVVVSFYPLAFLVKEVGGDKVQVTNLTPAGIEPHDYELSARDMMLIQQASLLVLNGGGFEAWGERVKSDLAGSSVMVLEIGEGLFSENDPHVWLSPEMFKQELQIVTQKLIELDSSNIAYYLKNSANLNVKLEELQLNFKQGLSDCRSKDFITSHQAFGYLAKEFGLREIAISGLSPEAEPSTRKLGEIAKLAKEKKIDYIFFEKLVSPKLSETIAQEVGAQTLVLDPIEGISDNEASQEKNYLSVMRENLTNLKIALQCQ